MSYALISPCEKYRYVLKREFTNDPVKPLLVCMLNPSTADADSDDPTIRRVISFAKREGYDSITVVNLYSFRATNPDEVFRSLAPYGPDNHKILAEQALLHPNVLLAWGAKAEIKDCIRAMRLFNENGCRMFCLGLTKGGHPKHPLYVSGDTPFQRIYMEVGETFRYSLSPIALDYLRD